MCCHYCLWWCCARVSSWHCLILLNIRLRLTGSLGIPRVENRFTLSHSLRGGFACAIQPHREVRPESGLSIYEVYDMKACRILTPFWAIGEGDEEEEEKGGEIC